MANTLAWHAFGGFDKTDFKQANAAPEWQARGVELGQGAGGGLSTQGAC